VRSFADPNVGFMAEEISAKEFDLLYKPVPLEIGIKEVLRQIELKYKNEWAVLS
jgi:hypothetical protein